MEILFAGHFLELDIHSSFIFFVDTLLDLIVVMRLLLNDELKLTIPLKIPGSHSSFVASERNPNAARFVHAKYIGFFSE